jgi:hypothetical protein
MATFKIDINLKHRANLGEDIEDVEFEAGDEIEILNDWRTRSLAKNASGELYNIPKDATEP